MKKKEKRKNYLLLTPKKMRLNFLYDDRSETTRRHPDKTFFIPYHVVQATSLSDPLQKTILNLIM